MKKTAIYISLIVMGLIFVFSAPSWAGKPGAFASALKNKFCTGTSGPQWYGCYAYMYYRVDYNKNNSTAKSYCHSYGCGKKYSNASDLNKCKSGCQKAYDADTR